MKSIGVISTTVLFLLAGFSAPANARQDKEQPPKQEEKAAAPKQQQQAKPQAQREQTKTQPVPQPKQQQAKSQPASPEKQQQTKTQPAQQQKQQTKTHPAQEQKQQQTKTQPAQQQKQQQAKTQPTQQPQQQASSSQRPQRTQQAMAVQRAQPQLRLSATSSSRIPEARFQSSFGREHNFRMSSPRMVDGFSRFQYGGYWFGFVQPWPQGWYYTDNVYIDYVDGGYFLYDPYYPGARVSISVVL